MNKSSVLLSGQLPLTLHQQVQTQLNEGLKRADEALREGDFDTQTAERIRVREMLDSLKAAVRIIAMYIDRQDARQPGTPTAN